jgi:ketosteroid isomerase-like protein
MKALIQTVLVLVSCISLAPVLAQPPGAASEAPGVADTIKQLEHEWANAMMAVDVDKLNQIVADDWVDGYPGKTTTKASFLADVKSGEHKLEACEFGAMDVKVLGPVAVVQGTVTETRTMNGRGTAFHVAYVDVFVKRGDRWLVVRSQSKKL